MAIRLSYMFQPIYLKTLGRKVYKIYCSSLTTKIDPLLTNLSPLNFNDNVESPFINSRYYLTD